MNTNKNDRIDFNEFLFFVAINGYNDTLKERLDLMFDLYVIQFCEYFFF